MTSSGSYSGRPRIDKVSTIYADKTDDGQIVTERCENCEMAIFNARFVYCNGEERRAWLELNRWAWQRHVEHSAERCSARAAEPRATP